MRKLLRRPSFIKLVNWEYWPFSVIYGPIYIYWFWLCIRTRSFFFFNAANPHIKNGGFLLESKKSIYDMIPGQYYPKTLFFQPDLQLSAISAELDRAGMVLPLIGKPDIGMRGLGVKKLETIKDVLDYARNSKVSFLLQEFVPFENEAGIFYYRLPDEEKGHITGIVGKEFLAVKGNGKLTIEELLKQDDRFILQLDILRKSFGDRLKAVLENGEKYLLVPYGNHCRGAKFLDISELADKELTATIDAFCNQVHGFYFGRLDIRYNTWEELKQGKNFSLIELNGAGSEPTHIYDPAHSIFFAWKEIIRHWNILAKISMLNHHIEKIPYMNVNSGIRMLRENRAYLKLISSPE